jgi:hypothetical protein
MALLAVSLAFNVVFLRGEARVSALPLNDEVFHSVASQRLAEAVSGGEPFLDPWVLGLGLRALDRLRGRGDPGRLRPPRPQHGAWRGTLPGGRDRARLEGRDARRDPRVVLQGREPREADRLDLRK